MPFGLGKIALTYTPKWYMDSSSRGVYERIVKCHYLHAVFCTLSSIQLSH